VLAKRRSTSGMTTAMAVPTPTETTYRISFGELRQLNSLGRRVQQIEKESSGRSAARSIQTSPRRLSTTR